MRAVPWTTLGPRAQVSNAVGILAVASHRRHCLIVGEDLGTMPKGSGKMKDDRGERSLLPCAVLLSTVLRAGSRNAGVSAVGRQSLPGARGSRQPRSANAGPVGGRSAISIKDRLGLFADPVGIE